MISGPELIWASLAMGLAGLLCALIGLISLRVQSARWNREQARIEADGQRAQTEASERLERIRASLEALDQKVADYSMEKAEEALRKRLQHSTRSQAIQLLRSGISPETAASSLGIATREMRLIAKVSRILSSV